MNSPSPAAGPCSPAVDNSSPGGRTARRPIGKAKQRRAATDPLGVHLYRKSDPVDSCSAQDSHHQPVLRVLPIVTPGSQAQQQIKYDLETAVLAVFWLSISQNTKRRSHARNRQCPVT
ncbi:hypothetical protein MGYG_05285 [Nannizzia gypsea CBS 118893]|uniref:Uncharacterized protein n=1 Tax=Arthroderma gypseum (strain ATCC MYA-4604 / CBS 118893) TaxID=535722 RepID=E4UVG0_ARTGP|nr:hypothetical protein MGYG_05285 [Nannizzia gypsea CBS 118893]EFR02287.1 hypothetical protein MGYG_05285 [Nannizzia gypsea CBS 118893]